MVLQPSFDLLHVQPCQHAHRVPLNGARRIIVNLLRLHRGPQLRSDRGAIGLRGESVGTPSSRRGAFANWLHPSADVLWPTFGDPRSNVRVVAATLGAVRVQLIEQRLYLP